MVRGEIERRRWLQGALTAGLLLAASCAEQAVEAGRQASVRETEQAQRAALEQARSAEQPPQQEEPAAPQPPSPAGASLQIVAREFEFEPASIQLEAGQPVTLTIVNQGAIAHDFFLQGLEADAVQGGRSGDQVYTPLVQAGESVSITFVPQASGTYSFICSVPGHAEAGMTGEASVSP